MATTKKKYYKTTISFDVLSEDPIPDDSSPEGILAEADMGMYVADNHRTKVEVLTGKQCARALRKFGSEPGFFNLNDRGVKQSSC